MEYFLNSFQVVFQRELYNKDELLEMTDKIVDKLFYFQYRIAEWIHVYINSVCLEQNEHDFSDFVIIDKVKPDEINIELSSMTI